MYGQPIAYLTYLTEKYFAYYTKYRSFPTPQLLISIVKDSLSEDNDVILRDQVVDFLHRLRSNPDMGDQQYVKDKTLDFLRFCPSAAAVNPDFPIF